MKETLIKFLLFLLKKISKKDWIESTQISYNSFEIQSSQLERLTVCYKQNVYLDNLRRNPHFDLHEQIKRELAISLMKKITEFDGWIEYDLDEINQIRHWKGQIFFIKGN